MTGCNYDAEGSIFVVYLQCQTCSSSLNAAEMPAAYHCSQGQRDHQLQLMLSDSQNAKFAGSLTSSNLEFHSHILQKFLQ